MSLTVAIAAVSDLGSEDSEALPGRGPPRKLNQDALLGHGGHARLPFSAPLRQTGATWARLRGSHGRRQRRQAARQPGPGAAPKPHPTHQPRAGASDGSCTTTSTSPRPGRQVSRGLGLSPNLRKGILSKLPSRKGNLCSFHNLIKENSSFGLPYSWQHRAVGSQGLRPDAPDFSPHLIPSS